MNEYIGLSTRSGFNKSLSHFRVVRELLQSFREESNVINLMQQLIVDEKIENHQILPILNALFVEKFSYSFISFNINRWLQNKDIIELHRELKKWNRFSTLIAYHNNSSVVLMNPAVIEQWNMIDEFVEGSLIVIYLKSIHLDDEVLEPEVLLDYKDFFQGKRKKSYKKYILKSDKPTEHTSIADTPPTINSLSEEPSKENTESPSEVQGQIPKEEPQKVKPPPPNQKMTPKYMVQVTNELFHNGNVEAWKNIIESYQFKYPHLQIYIFHDGQRVNNINSLFKWGKVNHGDAILFSIVGEDFKSISKLQRYLFEGASNRFQVFLKKDVNKVLNLF